MFTHLTHVDPDENMNRWYTVMVQPALLNPVAVITAWGSRENDFQQVRIMPAVSLEEAQTIAEKIVAMKTMRGYQQVIE